MTRALLFTVIRGMPGYLLHARGNAFRHNSGGYVSYGLFSISKQMHRLPTLSLPLCSVLFADFVDIGLQSHTRSYARLVDIYMQRVSAYFKNIA